MAVSSRFLRSKLSERRSKDSLKAPQTASLGPLFLTPSSKKQTMPWMPLRSPLDVKEKLAVSFTKIPITKEQIEMLFKRQQLGPAGQELHASPHIEHTPILSYPYISIYGYVLTIDGYEVLTSSRRKMALSVTPHFVVLYHTLLWEKRTGKPAADDENHASSSKNPTWKTVL